MGWMGGCDSAVSEPTPEPLFSAVINGEPRQLGHLGAYFVNPCGVEQLGVKYTSSTGEHGEWYDYLLFRIRWQSNVHEYTLGTYTDPDGTCSYPLRLGAFYRELKGSAIIGEYEGIQDEPSLLRITSFDRATGLLEGEFEVTVVVDDDFRDWPLRQMPDTVRVTDGRFRVVVEDRRGR